MDERLKESLDKVLEYVEKSCDFAVEQAPIVAQEIVTWQIWSGCLTVGLCLVFLCVFCLVSRPIIRWASDDSRKELALPPLGVVGVLIGIFTLSCGIPSAFCALKAYVAPRLVIIEKLTEMMN